MSQLFQASKIKTQSTMNGAVTNQSSLDSIVDLFFKIGASRNNPKEISENLFLKAYDQDVELATRVLLYSRDIRGGMGERNIFREVIKKLSYKDKDIAIRVLNKIPLLGRWDDLLSLVGTPVEGEALNLIKEGLSDPSCSSLVAKWMPRLRGNATDDNKYKAKVLAKHLGLSYQKYNKLLSSLSSTVEQQLSIKDYSSIDYSTLPSVAASRYQALFNRVDEERYKEYKEALVAGDENVKVNSGAVFPYDLTKSATSGDDLVSTAQWKNLPNFLEGNKDRILPITDVSGSMSTLVSGSTSAMDIAVALSLYISEKTEGLFHNKMVTFESRPSFIEVSDSMSLAEKVNHVKRAGWGGSTDLVKTFELILSLAIKYNLPEEEMPNKLLIVSDMEFNSASGGRTNFEDITLKYEQSGYKLPTIIFWNVCSQQSGNIPVTLGDKNTALVSGFSPSLLKGVLSGELDSVKLIKTLIMDNKYDF